MFKYGILNLDWILRLGLRYIPNWVAVDGHFFFFLDWMRPCEAVVVCRIEPRKGGAGKIFRNFMELEYF